MKAGRRAHRNVLLVVGTLLVVLAGFGSSAAAQSHAACEAQGHGLAVGLGLGRIAAEHPLEPPTTRTPGYIDSYRTRSGWWGGGHLDYSRGGPWRVRVRHDVGRIAAIHTREHLRSSDDIVTRTAGGLVNRRLGFAALKTSESNSMRRVCLSWLMGAAVHRFSYNGIGMTTMGISGGFTVVVRASARRSLLFEIEIECVDADSRPPLRGVGVFQLRASTGVQFRF